MAWLTPGRTKLNGRTATIPLEVSAVPDRPGEALAGQLTIQANGNQRFVIPVTLNVLGNEFDFGHLTADSPRKNAKPPPMPPAPLPIVPPKSSAAPLPAALPPVAVAAVSSSASNPGALPAEPPKTRKRPVRWNWRLPRPADWRHAIPAVVLVLLLGGLLIYDALSGPRGPSKDGVRKQIGFYFGDVKDPEPRLIFNPHPQGNLRFGLIMTKETDPRHPEKPKKLTYEENGGSNNTCVKIDGAEHIFGRKPGRLVTQRKEADRHAWMAAWHYDESDIQVTQMVQIVPGEQTGYLDTCLIRYTIENKGRRQQTVGLRVLFDTYIGAEDGVPFAIAGRPGLLSKPTTFKEKEVPEHVEALERPDPSNPGTVAYMGLKNLQLPDVVLEPIVKMVIGTWPGSEKKWEWEEDPSTKDQDIKDSSIALYWDYRKTEPGEVREMAFSYGLNVIGSAEGDSGGPLALSTGGSYQVGKEFTVTAYLKNPKLGQRLKLVLPETGLELADGQAAEQEIKEAGEFTQVSWRVRAKQEGTYTLGVVSEGARASYRVKITNRGLFR